jgi:heme/copper-type cytochrome/quinol oxidase subunit 3
LKKTYVLGMYWFIFSEVMFFLAFFGALFYVRNLAGPWLAGEGEGRAHESPALGGLPVQLADDADPAGSGRAAPAAS